MMLYTVVAEARFTVHLTLSEATARSKVEKCAMLQERFYQKKRSTFANYNLTLSESTVWCSEIGSLWSLDAPE